MPRTLTRLAALLLMAALAYSGEYLKGASCCNRCPLAKQANSRLADGREALSTSTVVRADIVRRVLADMDAI